MHNHYRTSGIQPVPLRAAGLSPAVRSKSGIQTALLFITLLFLSLTKLSAQGSCVAEGGDLSLADGSTTYITCAGDGISDAFTPLLENNIGSGSAWLITNNYGLILGTPAGPTFDLEGAGEGVCFLYHLSYADGFSGDISAGDNICHLSTADGCFDLSNYVAVIRRTGDDCNMTCSAEGGDISVSGTNGETAITICAGDGVSDAFGAELSGESGTNSGWLISDLDGNILGLPAGPPFDLDGAGAGTCLVYHISYEDDITGLEMGGNTMELGGCYNLSNFIQVNRNQPNGGTLEGGPFEFTVGDNEADMIPEGAITVANSQGENFQWIVTDDEGNILGLPPTFSAVNFDGAGPGTCQVWYLRYDGEVSGLAGGLNISDIEGCSSISNPVQVIRTAEGDCQANGGALFGGPFEFTVGDDEADMIPEGAITVANSQGENFQWIVTDDEGNILGLPPTFSAVNFDGAGPGTCQVWYLRYDGEVSGLAGGLNISDIEGCSSISNPVQVIRTAEGDCQANGGALFGGPFEFTVGDDEADMIPEGAITVANSQGENFQWIVTDDEGNILGLPPTFSAVNFDGAGPGTCQVWYLRYDGEVSGLAGGLNISDIEGCSSISNPVQVIRTAEGDCQANGGALFGGPFEFTVGDGVADMIPEGAITVANSQGENFQWIVTDDEGNILGLPPTFSAVNFDGAGPGTCQVWYLRYDGEVSGLAGGLNISDIEGCSSISNPVQVIRTAEGDCQANGGALFGGPFEFTVGDGVADMIPEGAITVANSQGENFQWIVTDDEGNILGLPPTFSAVNFDGAGPGTCQVWYLRYDGEVSGLAGGLNISDIEGCSSISNPVQVIRTAEGDCQANGGALFGGPFEFTVGDGVADMIPEGAITVANSQGENFQWIVTDDQGNILGLPPTFSVVNFDGAGVGTCLVWYLRYDGEISGLASELNISDLEGCFDLSNSIEVVRTEGDCIANGGEITLADGSDATSICIDGVADPLEVIRDGNGVGTNRTFVITDDQGNILAIPGAGMNGPFNLDPAGPGTCEIWYLAYEDGLVGLAEGNNLDDLEGCFGLSNRITVVRQAPDGGTVATTNGATEVTACAGDVMVDVTHMTTATALSYWYIITDANDNILGFANSADVSTLDLSSAPAGECHIWGWSYRGEGDPVMGENISTLADGDCEAISTNFIRVIRQSAEAGSIALEDGSSAITICAGDGTADPLAVIMSGTTDGDNSTFFITDANTGEILGVPPTVGPFDLDGAGAGICEIWYLSGFGAVDGVVMGGNIADIAGCYDLSNPITVTRLSGEDCNMACMANGGGISLADGSMETSICVDGVADPLEVIRDGNGVGANRTFVITDDQGNILAIPGAGMNGPFNLDPAGPGTCEIWYLAYEDGLAGLAEGNNLDDLDGCFGLSNRITVVRQAPDGGTVTTANGATEVTACAGDVIVDVTHMTTATALSYWYIITDANDNILGFANSADMSTLDLSNAPAGECHIWGWSYRGEGDPVMGENISTLADGDCEAISTNFIRVTRQGANGGVISLATGGDEATICADGTPDPLSVVMDGTGSGDNSTFIITDLGGTILGIPGGNGPFDLDGAGAGVCQIWYLAYADGLVGLEEMANVGDFMGCYDLSNPITVTRNTGTDCDGGGFQFPTVIISEVAANGFIELYNDTDMAVDVSPYWLCDFPTYTQVGDLQVECGNLLIQPGEVVVVSGFSAFNDQDAELGLYINSSFSSSSAIISYLEWGSAGHTRASVAIAAGIWTSNFFLDMPGAGSSLQQVVNDSDEAEWVTADASFCDPNNFGTGTTSFNDEDATLSTFPNPATFEINVETADFDEGSSMMQLMNINGQVVYQRELDYSNGLTQIDLGKVQAGTYLLRVSTAKAVRTEMVIITN